MNNSPFLQFGGNIFYCSTDFSYHYTVPVIHMKYKDDKHGLCMVRSELNVTVITRSTL